MRCNSRDVRKFSNSRGGAKIKGGKENVWSVDNEMANEKEKEKMKRRRKKKGVGRMRNVTRRGHGDGDKVMVSGAMLMEVETVLQTQVLPLLLSSFWLFSLLLSVQFFFFLVQKFEFLYC